MKSAKKKEQISLASVYILTDDVCIGGNEMTTNFWQGSYLVTLFDDGRVSVGSLMFANKLEARDWANTQGFSILF